MFNRLMGKFWPFGIGGVGVEDGGVKAAEAGCNPLQQASLVQQPYNWAEPAACGSQQNAEVVAASTDESEIILHPNI
jgi:hypothetical protein